MWLEPGTTIVCICYSVVRIIVLCLCNSLQWSDLYLTVLLHRLAVDVNSTNSGSGTTTGCSSGVKCSNSSNSTSSTSTANLTTTRHICSSSSGSSSSSHSKNSTTTTTHNNNISKQLPSIKHTTTTTAVGGRVYRGTVDCLRTTYALEGIRGVYAGFGVTLAGKRWVLFHILCYIIGFYCIYCIIWLGFIEYIVLYSWVLLHILSDMVGF